MLILERRKGEVILIGEEGDIRVTVVHISDGSVKLGIAAPRDIPVHREEVFRRILENGDSLLRSREGEQ